MTENIYECLIKAKTSLAVVGLGYVGMPIAVAFASKGLDVIGFDTDSKKIELNYIKAALIRQMRSGIKSYKKRSWSSPRTRRG